MMRSTIVAAMMLCGAAPSLPAQHRDLSGQRESFQRAVVHTGKWLTAASVAALIVFAEREHSQSRREWNALLDVCRSAQDACALGSDGRYVRSDAEQLYQRSRAYDRRANRWLLGAEAGLLATTALFIIDLHPGQGPDNIPFAPIKVGVRLPL
jgi:hypothetical protein